MLVAAGTNIDSVKSYILVRYVERMNTLNFLYQIISEKNCKHIFTSTIKTESIRSVTTPIRLTSDQCPAIGFTKLLLFLRTNFSALQLKLGTYFDSSDQDFQDIYLKIGHS